MKDPTPHWLVVARLVDELVFACLAYPVLRRSEGRHIIDMEHRAREAIDTLRDAIVVALEEGEDPCPDTN